MSIRETFMLSKEKIYAVANELAHARYNVRTSRNMWLDAEDEAVAQSWNRKYKRDLGALHGIEDILEIVVDADSNDAYEVHRISKEIIARLKEQEAA